MKRILTAIAFALFFPGVALAQVCPGGSTCSPLATFLATLGVNFGTGLTTLNYTTSGTLPPAVAGSVFQAVGPDATNSRYDLSSFGFSKYDAVCFGGTSASKTAVGSGIQCGGFDIFAWDGTSLSGALGGFHGSTAEVQSSGHHGGNLFLTTVPIGSASGVDRVEVANDGGVLIPPTVTGGDCGAGCLNAAGLQVNGVPVGAGGSGTVNAGTAPQAAYYATSTTAVSGNPNVTYETGFTKLNYTTSGTAPAQVVGSVFQAVGPDATNARADLTAFGIAKYDAVCFGGTSASKTAVGSGIQCGGFDIFAWDGTSLSGAIGGFHGTTAEVQSSGHHGGNLFMTTVPTGSASGVDRMEIGNDGGITVPPTVTGGSQGAGTINMSGCFINGVACATSSGGGVTWPASTDIVISNGTSAPGGLAPVNGSLAIGGGGAWTTLPIGTNAYVLTSNGSTASWQASIFGPGGSSGQVQWNNSATLGGTSGLTVSSNKVLSMSVGLGSDATGDIYYNGGSGAFTRLGIGANTYVLTSNGSVPTWAPASGGGGGNFFTSAAATAGGPTTYTLAMSGYVATSGNYVCTPSFTPTNGANPTLNVNSTGAKPIQLPTSTGLVSLAGGEIPNTGKACFIYDGTNYVYQSSLVAAPAITATDTVNLAKWNGCQAYVISTAAQTITLPTSTGLPTGGCINLSTIGVTATLAPTGASGDAIDNGQIGGGAANASITIPADFTGTVTYSGTPGTAAFLIPLGPVQYRDLTWAEGLNLSTNARFVGRFATPRVVYGIKCNVQAAAGSASTVHLFSTASGVAPGSGTALDTTGCNANASSNTEQDMGVAGNPIVAAYTVWATFSGAGTSGNGGLTISYR